MTHNARLCTMLNTKPYTMLDPAQCSTLHNAKLYTMLNSGAGKNCALKPGYHVQAVAGLEPSKVVVVVINEPHTCRAHVNNTRLR